MTDCSQCKGLKRSELLAVSLACKGKEFYEPREISFCPHQITWLLRHIEELHEHRWATGYEVDIPRRKRPGGGGYFETPADYAYEVERRLWHCGLDGLLTYLFYAYDLDADFLSKYYRMGQYAVRHRIEVVVWHVSGWNYYLDTPYRRWHVDRNYETWRCQQEVRALP